MFRPALPPFVLSGSVSWTPVHLPQSVEPWNLPGSRRQYAHAVGSETYARPSGSIPAITIHPSPQEVDRGLSSLNAGTDVSGVHPQTPDEYLQLGIKHHEANRLEESALCFERSAKEQGGCGVGMLMYGLTLRHGWGCPRNEKSGFHWLKKAAELALADLEKGKQGVDAMAIRVSLSEMGIKSRR